MNTYKLFLELIVHIVAIVMTPLTLLRLFTAAMIVANNWATSKIHNVIDRNI
jgi:hypothetical protein